MLKVVKFITQLLLLSWLFFAVNQAGSTELEAVTLQLKWKHQFQFAGYYAAKQQGFYENAGLEVTLLEASSKIDVVQEVLSGHAQYGVGTSELILNRYRGDPVVVIGVVFQHSPLALVSLVDSGIDNIHKLAGRKVMIEPSSAELFAYLQHEGVVLKTMDLQQHSLDLNDLLSGRTDAMSVYITDELYLLNQSGRAYHQFLPRMSSVDFYGDNFFTVESEIKNHPERAKAFRAATLKGWHYAMENTEEIIQLIYKHYSQRHSIEHLRFEAEVMRDLMQPNLIEPGYMTTGRWQQNAKTYWQIGMLPETFDVESMLFISEKFDLAKLKKTLYLSVVVLLVLGGLIVILFRFYRRSRVNEDRLNTMFNLAPLSFIVIDEQNIVQSWNAEAEKIFQWRTQDVIGKNIKFLVSPSCHSEVEDKLSIVHKKHKVIHSENTNLKQDGSEILCEWINAPFKDQAAQSKYIICMARDITEQKRLQQQLEHAAHYDNLTSLPNRALILKLLEKSISVSARQKTKLALLFLDLNKFKEINDEHGHAVGDILLMTIAKRLPQALRSGDYPGRLAGDEFLVVLHDVGTLANACMVANKMQKLIQQPCVLKDKTISISASVGISLFPDDGDDISTLINTADHAMYQAKLAAHPAANVG